MENENESRSNAAPDRHTMVQRVSEAGKTLFQGSGPARRRVPWLTAIAVLLSVVAVIVELATRICAENFFDPLPDFLWVAAYLFLPVMMEVNGALLGSSEPTLTAVPSPDDPGIIRRRRRAITAALLLTGMAIGVVLVFVVMFVPLLPISIPTTLMLGLGLCVWSPFLNLIVLVTQHRGLLSRWTALGMGSARLGIATSVVVGLVAMVILLGRPLIIGYNIQRSLQCPENREDYIATLRLLKADRIVLGLCYRDQAPPWVSFGESLAQGTMQAPTTDGMPYGWQVDTTSARKVYYLMTDKAFEDADTSGIVRDSRMTWDGWDEDPVQDLQGGELIGRSIKGLSLASSGMWANIDPASEMAGLDWTMSFRNSGSKDQEARAEVLLPEGGFVDGAWIRINGKQIPAAFGPVQVTREAYRAVVAVHHDPLLVTARAGDRVMVQCFPVPAGQVMQIHLHINAPLVWKDPASPRLCFSPPAFQQVNFALPKELHEGIIAQGDMPADSTIEGAGWQVEPIGPGSSGETPGPASDSASHAVDQIGYVPLPVKPPALVERRALVELSGAEAIHPPALFITGLRAPSVSDALGWQAARLAPALPAASDPVNLQVLVDTTADMESPMAGDSRDRLAAALASLPPGSRVRFADTRAVSRGDLEDASVWLLCNDRNSMDRWWNQRTFVGGVDADLPIVWALKEAEAAAPSAVLWIHGTMPADYADTGAVSTRYADQAPLSPPLIGLQLRPGPDAVMDSLVACAPVRALTARTDIDPFAEAVKVAALCARPPGVAMIRTDRAPLGGRLPATNGVFFGTGDRGMSGATELLRQHSLVLQAYYAGQGSGPGVDKAQKRAIRQRLVTPVSGAVVLADAEQYQGTGLEPGVDRPIPSVPEPGLITLLATGAGVGLAGLVRRRRG